jgi:hypothetical protein
MSTISSMIKGLTESYKDLSVELVQDLCNMAGVEYRNPKEAKRIVEDMYEVGYRLKIVKFAESDQAVGQYIILTDLELNVVKGFKVWIDFTDYAVRKENIKSNEEVPFIKGNGGEIVN